MRFEAAIFDLDGTLVDTTHLYAEACIHAMQTLGLSFSSEDFAKLYPTGTSFFSWAEQKGAHPDDLPQARQERDTVYCELLRTRTVYLPGAKQLLKKVGKKRSAVVTNSWKIYVDAINEATGIYDHMETVITADHMGAYCKPHPHGLLLAADALGIEPSCCMYVGDQAYDVEAAKAAGMTPAFIPSRHSPKEPALQDTKTVLPSLHHLHRHLL